MHRARRFIEVGSVGFTGWPVVLGRVVLPVLPVPQGLLHAVRRWRLQGAEPPVCPVPCPVALNKVTYAAAVRRLFEATATALALALLVGAFAVGADAASPKALSVRVMGADRNDISASCELSGTDSSVIAAGRVKRDGLGHLSLSVSVFDAEGAVLNLQGLAHSASVPGEEGPWQADVRIIPGFAATRCVVDLATPQELKSFSVPSTAMDPTVTPGDHVVVNTTAYSTSHPRSGDIIVFRRPAAENCGGQPVTDLLKRVIGLPGETVEVRDNKVYLNGKVLPEPWLPAATSESNPYTANYGPVTVPAGDYFVMGDNRTRSCDSRMWGPVKGSAIVGQVVQIVQGTPPATTPTTSETGTRSTSTTSPETGHTETGPTSSRSTTTTAPTTRASTTE
jgi:signal peptidase I